MAFEAVFATNWEGRELNPDVLRAEAAAAFGKRFFNCDAPRIYEYLANGDDVELTIGVEGSFDERGLELDLLPPVDADGNPLPYDLKDDLALWEAIIEAHDPDILTADQEIAEAEAAEKLALQDAAENWASLDDATKDYMMQLTVKIAARAEG